MGTTQPIRSTEELRKFMDYYQKVHPSIRNYALISFGLHTALRISDILDLKWGQVYDFDGRRFVKHLTVIEKKTGKENMIALNRQLIRVLDDYRKKRKPKPEDYLFTKSTNYQTPLCRSQAFRIIKAAATEALHEQNISCHSLRKTFGYQAWKKGAPPALLMDIYHHSSYQITQRYLGIDQDERDHIYLDMHF